MGKKLILFFVLFLSYRNYTEILGESLFRKSSYYKKDYSEYSLPLADSNHTPSKERGNPTYRTQAQLEANKIRATVFNFGQTGRTTGSAAINKQTPYEWPKYSGQVYLALTGLFIGGEVVDNSGDTIRIVDVPNYRSSPNGITWNFEPMPGYFNPTKNQIATSTDPSTWPEYWPNKMNDPNDPGWKNSWNGIHGKNIFIDGQEIYYRMTDNLYDRYNYSPDVTDITRKGLGLIIECRAMEFADYPFEDIVFQHYKIINDGTKELKKLIASIWNADFVGGDGDSGDDKIYYDLSDNLLISYDTDKRAPTFNEHPVGALGVSLLKTPPNSSGVQSGLTSINSIPAGGLNIYDDDDIWEEIIAPGIFIDPTKILPGEYDQFLSSGYFSLKPGESTDFIAAIILANGSKDDLNSAFRISEIKRKLAYAKFLLETSFNPVKGTLTITNPTAGQIFNGKISINWAHNLNGQKVRSEIFFSSDFGVTWSYAGTDSNNTGNYELLINNYPDGVHNKIKIFAYNADSYCITESKEFTINKNEESVPPQIVITSPIDNQTIDNTFRIKWNGGDADGDNYIINLYSRLNANEEWNLLASDLENGKGYLDFDTRLNANSKKAEFKTEIIAGNDTTSYIAKNISIENYYNLPGYDLINLLSSTLGSGIFEVHVTNMDEISGHDYLIKFLSDSSNKTYYDVDDLTTGAKKIEHAYTINGITEGPYFDGIRLYIQADSIYFNTTKSKWNSTEVFPFRFEQFAYRGIKRTKKIPADYKIIFGDVGIGKSKEIKLSTMIFSEKNVNFKVINPITKNEVEFGFIEVDGIDGKLSAYGNYRDRIIFLENAGNDSLEFTYWVYLIGETGKRIPTKGDTLYIYQYKPYLPGDSISFSTKNFAQLLDVSESGYPISYKLNQNYPNPFNSVTNIIYTVPKQSFVTIKIYDILGREISTLVNKLINEGTYRITFESKNLPSGIYFYTLRTKDFMETKKMLLLK